MIALVALPIVAAIAFAIGLAVLSNRWSAKLVPGQRGDRNMALSALAHANRAEGTNPFSKGGALRFQLHGVVFRLTSAEFGKTGPSRYWLGAELPDASVERSAYRARGGGRPLTQPIDRLPYLLCRPETRMDALGKRLGLNREPQSGDPTFDDVFYVETSMAKEATPILALPSFHAAARECAALESELVLNAEGHAVAVRLDRNGLLFDTVALDRALEALAALALDLPPVRDRTLRKAKGFAWGQLFTALGGISFLLIATAVAIDVGVEGAGFVDLATKVAGATFAVSVLMVWLVSRGRPRGLARFLTGFGLALAGSAPLSAGALSVVNRVGDESHRIVRAAFVEKRSSRGKNSTSYYVTTGPWEGQPDGAEIKVDGHAFEAAKPGVEIELELGEGRLGYAWVRGYKVLR